MVIKDLAVSGGAAQSHLFMSDFMYGKEGSIVTVNGQVNPVLSVKRGQVQRWRIINASNARFYRLYLENHVMYLIGTDGGLLDKPYTVSTLVLAPGERADVLIKATSAQGRSRLISLPYSRQSANGSTAILAGMSMSDQTRSSQLPAYYGAGMYRQGAGVTGVYGSGLYGYGSASGGTSGGMGSGSASDGGSGTDGLYGTGTFGGQNPAAYAFWPKVTETAGDDLRADTRRTRRWQEPGRHRPGQGNRRGHAHAGGARADTGEPGQPGALGRPAPDTGRSGVGIRATHRGSSDDHQRLLAAEQQSELGIQPVHVRSSGLLRRRDHVFRLECRRRRGMGGSSGTTLGNYDMSAAVQVTLLTMSAEGSVVDDVLPSTLGPAASEPSVDLSTLPKRTIIFNMDMGNGYLNGMDYDKGPFTIGSAVGGYEIWEVVNPTVLDQPFHLQASSFRVLSIVGGDADYGRIYTGSPARKDTIIVPRMGTVSLLVHVASLSDDELVRESHPRTRGHRDAGQVGDHGRLRPRASGEPGGGPSNGAAPRPLV